MPDDLIPKPKPEVERIEPDELAGVLEVGQWYWVKNWKIKKEWVEDEEGEDVLVEKSRERADWFGCIVHVGSNYALLEGLDYHQRVHFDDFDKLCTREKDPQGYIQSQVKRFQDETQRLMREVQEITQRLGVASRPALPQVDQTHALATLNANQNQVEGYKGSLIQAKDEKLPELFDEIKHSNEAMARWLSAPTIPLKAQANGLKEILGKVNDRLFHVELYAGLTEQVVQAQDGEPAPAGEKLHIMQSMLYMDEECLAQYRLGGMVFDNIKAFDRWLCEPENLNRLLPFPRTMVAFRVRYQVKDRGGMPSDIRSLFIRFQLEKEDKYTFLYVRNGEQVYRISTALEFGGSLFPDRDEMPDGDKLYGKKGWGGKIESLISKSEYNLLVEDYLREEKEAREWRKGRRAALAALPEGEDLPYDHPYTWHREPYRHRSDDPRDTYQPFNPTNVYYDDCMKKLQKQIQYYNRIVLIIQGLFDRSPVLHPHAPVKTWDPDSLDANVKLVYQDRGLYDGEKPDFQAYWDELSKQLTKGSVTIGQQDIWREREVERSKNDGRSWDRDAYHSPRWGDPGPGELATVVEWKPRARKATFRWTRERSVCTEPWHDYDDRLPCSIEIKADHLFNVSAYKPGDFRQFYADPRTRRDYLEWASFLITAEEYHAGNLVIEDDGGMRLKKKLRKIKKNRHGTMITEVEIKPE